MSGRPQWEEVTITRHGVPVGVVVRPDTLRAPRGNEAPAADQRVRDLLARGRATPLESQAGLTEARGNELVDEVRAARARN